MIEPGMYNVSYTETRTCTQKVEILPEDFEQGLTSNDAIVRYALNEDISPDEWSSDIVVDDWEPV